jgi:hypothetical protein
VNDMDTNYMPAGNAGAVLRPLPWLTSSSIVVRPRTAVASADQPRLCDHGMTECVTVGKDADSKFSTSLGSTASPPV